MANVADADETRLLHQWDKKAVDVLGGSSRVAMSCIESSTLTLKLLEMRPSGRGLLSAAGRTGIAARRM